MPRADGSMELDEVSPKKPESKSNRKSKSTNSNGHDCNICRKSNMTLSGLKIHLLTHSGEKPYHCTVCDKRFTCSSNLKKHQRIHNKDYIYACEVCGKTCSDPSNMKKHMTVHSGEKAHVCPSCGKSYSYAQSLRQHMDDVHVGNGERRPKTKRKGHFPCPECGKVFGYYWRCSLHQARVHAVDRPYKCPECGKCFARETILNKHLQTHEKPYPCTECDRRFSFRDQLQKHKRTHSGERPYQCETCLRSFSQRGSLNEHMRTHTGIKPFACQICGVKFASSSSLRRHERKVKSCFPAPQGEEIPMGNMYPRRAIYVHTPPINIPRVETAPVIDTHSSTWVQNPYTPSSSSVGEISTTNLLLTENGLDERNSTTESNNEIGKNYDVNGNFEATLVPNSQISMVVRCDKNGKISVLPVTLQLVNGTTQFAVTNSEPNISEPSNHHPHQPNQSSDLCRPTFSEPTNHSVTMATSNYHHPPYRSISTSTNSQPTFLIASDTPVAMETMNGHHHGNPNEPNFATDVDDVEPKILPEYPSMSAVGVKQEVAENNEYSPTVSADTMTNGIETFSTITNRTLATSPPITVHQPATIQQHPSTMVSTKNSPSPSNQSTSSYCTTQMPTITKANPTLDIRPILPQNQHHLPTNRQVRQPPSTSITLNGEYTNHHPVITTSGLHRTSPADVNNNMVSENINDHLPVKYFAISNGPESTNPLNTPVSSLVAVSNNNLGDEPPSMYGEATKYNVPIESLVLTTNGYYMQSPPHILLPSTMIKPQSTIMEPRDVKPIIGVDVPAFNQ